MLNANVSWLFALFLILFMLAIPVCAVWLLYRQIRNTLRKFSREAFGTDSLMEGISLQKDLLADTPKSVSGMTTVYLPQIQKDFPEFSLPEYIHKAENLLRNVLAALESQDIHLLYTESTDLKNQVALLIEDQVRQGIRERYRDIQIYQTEVYRYEKSKGCCTIGLQSAVSYLYWKENRDTEIGNPENSKKIQTLYDVDLMYIQDASLLPPGTTAIAATCPHCGAPVTNLGDKFCEYCGSGVETVNVRVWRFVRVIRGKVEEYMWL